MRLILYDNNSFRLRVQYPHGTSNYSGSYSLNKNVITIEDSLIEKKSKNNITTSYLLETKNLKLISEKSSFKNLAIQQSTAHNTSLAKQRVKANYYVCLFFVAIAIFIFLFVKFKK